MKGFNSSLFILHTAKRDHSRKRRKNVLHFKALKGFHQLGRITLRSLYSLGRAARIGKYNLTAKGKLSQHHRNAASHMLAPRQTGVRASGINGRVLVKTAHTHSIVFPPFHFTSFRVNFSQSPFNLPKQAPRPSCSQASILKRLPPPPSNNCIQVPAPRSRLSSA